MKDRKRIVFLSSSYVNLACNFAQKYREYDIFLIFDRKIPFDVYDLDNFYTYTFANQKLFERNPEQYFDNLSVFIEKFEPDFIITNNFTKLLPKSFIEFGKFRNPNLKIINIHNADLNKGEEMKEMNPEIKEFLKYKEITSILHLIEDEGKILATSHPTTLKELKRKKLVHNAEKILNPRVRNVILNYHERTKVLNLLHKTVEGMK